MSSETQPSRRSALRCIKSAFRKAVTECKLLSPIAALKLPEEVSRDHVVTKEEYEQLLAEISDETFSDLIKFVWLTGARPQEAYIIEDSQVDLSEQRIIIPAKKAKGKKRARVIYLPPDALAIVKAKMGNGRIFRPKMERRSIRISSVRDSERLRGIRRSPSVSAYITSAMPSRIAPSSPVSMR